MSSTAIVMATLGERGELASEHGRTTFVARTAPQVKLNRREYSYCTAAGQPRGLRG